MSELKSLSIRICDGFAGVDKNAKGTQVELVRQCQEPK
jgi:hypothetical protein